MAVVVSNRLYRGFFVALLGPEVVEGHRVRVRRGGLGGHFVVPVLKILTIRTNYLYNRELKDTIQRRLEKL